jgi:hypothetical protein
VLQSYLLPFSFCPELLPARFAVEATATTATATAAPATVTSAATAATVTAATATAATTTVASTTTAATTAATVSLWPRFVNRQITTAEVSAVKLFDGCCGAVLRRHLDEGETTRTACVAVFHYRSRFDFTSLCEEVAQFIAGGAEREIAHIESDTHFFILFESKGSAGDCWFAGAWEVSPLYISASRRHARCSDINESGF